MSQFNWNEFDAGSIETPSRDPIPAGEYVAIITDSTMKPNKAGTGEYLALSFQIAEGEHKDRFVWANLNVVHTNEKAAQIARAELASLCKAAGVMTPKDSSELHDKPVLIRVAIDKDRDGNPRNVIKGYKPVGGTPALAAEKPAAKAAPAKSSVPPWKRK